MIGVLNSQFERFYLRSSVVLEQIEGTWGPTGLACVFGEEYRHGTGNEALRSWDGLQKPRETY